MHADSDKAKYLSGNLMAEDNFGNLDMSVKILK
jgi:hypothetical protein